VKGQSVNGRDATGRMLSGPLPRARGAAGNPKSRFARLHYLEDPEHAEHVAGDPEQATPPVATRYYDDPSRSILATNDSPDVPFDVSLNPYRGCLHGCIYCFARPTHEYLDFSAGLDFETRILVKRDAPRLLRRALESPQWRPQVVGLGAVTDAYQPVERRLELTRRCLEVFAELRNPVSIVTKSALVARDVDLLADLARDAAAAVFVSVTTLDASLARIMEPRAAPPQRRLATVEGLARAGVPVAAMIAPVIPALNDHEVPALVEAVARAGAGSARMLMLRLPHGLGPLFESWLERHFPERRAKVLGRIRAMRAGRLNDPRFHERMRGSGALAEQTRALFDLTCRRAGLPQEGPRLSAAAFRQTREPQLALFGDPPRP
jgi:DNA repair photolyase